LIRSVPLRPGTWPVFCVAVLAADAGPLCADASEEGAGLSGAGDDAAVGNEATCLSRPGEFGGSASWGEDGAVTRRSSNYPPELRERAVRMVAEVRPDYPSDWPAIVAVAQKLGIGTAETLRKWVRQAEVDAGQRPGVTSEESAEMRRLKRENAELRRANEILKAASVFFASVSG
jgi:transposase